MPSRCILPYYIIFHTAPSLHNFMMLAKLFRNPAAVNRSLSISASCLYPDITCRASNKRHYRSKASVDLWDRAAFIWWGFQFHKSATACATSWDEAKGCWAGGESEPIAWWTNPAFSLPGTSLTLLPPPPESNGKRRSGYFCDVCPWIVNAFELADCALLSLSWLIRPKGRSRRE